MAKNKKPVRRPLSPITDENEFISPPSPPNDRSTLLDGYTNGTTTLHDHIIDNYETEDSQPYGLSHQEKTSSVPDMSNENAALPEPSSSRGRIESADVAVKEIQADKNEARHIIATHGIDPVALLHMGKSCLL